MPLPWTTWCARTASVCIARQHCRVCAAVMPPLSPRRLLSGHRVALLEQLDSHIESTLQQRQVLAARLQRSFADSCVPVEYECQRCEALVAPALPLEAHCRAVAPPRRDFVDLAHAIPDFIRSYATAQGALQWLAEFDVHARPMVRAPPFASERSHVALTGSARCRPSATWRRARPGCRRGCIATWCSCSSCAAR